MRELEYFSPTSFQLLRADLTAFYTHYLSDNKGEREPQTQPMAAGAAFDAHIKNFMAKEILSIRDERFDLDKIFEDQVEEHNRDWAKKAGRYLFNAYKFSGALADLILLLEASKIEPRMEFKIEQRVAHESDTGVPILGKPDIFIITKEGARIVLDFKVNGFCSKTKVYPRSGYIKVLDGWDHSKLGQSKNHGLAHRDCLPSIKDGVVINIMKQLEDVDKSWAIQLAMYGWVLGVEVGGNFITCIDQLCCTPTKGEFPLINVAQHRTTVSPQFQKNLYTELEEAWEIVTSDHIFRDLSLEDSQARCKVLDELAGVTIPEWLKNDRKY